MNTELEDIFKEELSKKEQKEQKKKDKQKKAEEKKKRKLEKKLEKKENKEFKKQLEQEEEEVNINDVPIPTTRSERRELEETRELMKELKVLQKNTEEEIQKHPNFLAEIFLGLALVALFLLSIDYVGYCYFKKPEALISSGILAGTTISFIFAMVIKKEGWKKFFTFVTALAFIGFIIYQILSV